MKILNKNIFNLQSITGVNTYESIPFIFQHIYGFSVHYIFTGTATGTIKIQVSNDVVDSPDDIVNWVELTTHNIAVNAGTQTQYSHNIDALYYKWLKVVYTNATNNGTISANLNMKGV